MLLWKQLLSSERLLLRLQHQAIVAKDRNSGGNENRLGRTEGEMQRYYHSVAHCYQNILKFFTPSVWLTKQQLRYTRARFRFFVSVPLTSLKCGVENMPCSMPSCEKRAAVGVRTWPPAPTPQLRGSGRVSAETLVLSPWPQCSVPCGPLAPALTQEYLACVCISWDLPILMNGINCL